MDKNCRFQLKKFELNAEDISHVCIAHNFFPLLQYILLIPDDILWHHSYFFVNEYLPENIRAMIPCSSFIDGKTSFKNGLVKRWNKLSFRFLKYVKYPFLKTAVIYAYDIPYLNLLIGHRDYGLLADAPNWLTLNMQEHSVEYNRQLKRAASFIGKIQKVIYGDLFINYFGRNTQCKKVYLTEENISPVLKNKEVIINPLNELWTTASSKKKSFVMRLFDISEEDVSILNSRPIVFFSQPLMDDCGMTELEVVDVHKKIFSNYKHTDILIKTHPRDKFDYRKYFPDMVLYTKQVNIQLLCLLGVTPQKVVTICSTAVEAFPETIECDYYGTSIHPKIERYLGCNYLPKRTVVFKKVFQK